MDKRDASKIQEKRITKSLKQIIKNTKRQIASGAMWFAKGDILSSFFLIEAKTKVKPSKQFTIKKEWLEKIYSQALEVGKIPVLAISFGDNEDYYVLRSKDFIEIIAKCFREGGSFDRKHTFDRI